MLWVHTYMLWVRDVYIVGETRIYCGSLTIYTSCTPTIYTSCTHNKLSTIYLLCTHNIFLTEPTIYTVAPTIYKTRARVSKNLAPTIYTHHLYILWVQLYISLGCPFDATVVGAVVYIVGMYCGLPIVGAYILWVMRYILWVYIVGCIVGAYVLWVRIYCGCMTPTIYTSCTHNTHPVCIYCGYMLCVILVLPMYYKTHSDIIESFIIY